MDDTSHTLKLRATFIVTLTKTEADDEELGKQLSQIRPETILGLIALPGKTYVLDDCIETTVSHPTAAEKTRHLDHTNRVQRQLRYWKMVRLEVNDGRN